MKRDRKRQKTNKARLFLAGAMSLTAVAQSYFSPRQTEQTPQSSQPAYTIKDDGILSNRIRFAESPKTYTINKVLFALARASGLSDEDLKTARGLPEIYKILELADADGDGRLTAGELNRANNDPRLRAEIVQTAYGIGWPTED